MNRDRLQEIIHIVFEKADDDLLSDHDWCKHSCMDDRNEMHEAECILLDLIHDYHPKLDPDL